MESLGETDILSLLNNQPITRIHIRLYSDYISLFLASPEKEVAIDYEKHPDGSAITVFQGKEKHSEVVNNSYFAHVACQHIQTVLINQSSSLDELAVVMLFKLDEKRELNQCGKYTFEKLKEILKSRECLLKVDSFIVTVTDGYQVLQLLPHICSESLRRLTINNAKEPNQQKSEELLDMEEIVKTMQYEKAKELAILGFAIEPMVESLVGFRTVQVAVKSISFEWFMELKKSLGESSNFEFIQLRFLEADIDQLIEALYGFPSGETDQLGHKRRQWFLKTSDPKKVDSIIIFLDNVLYSRMESSRVPDDAQIV
ncbi:hypothetical protein GCK72_019785 [Caenorhabditis remanei]|uniref:DUF38 domain-containing protein n=1 Tax=Caenorhabditis remanei TaxID=31234 RepID=A0A6A5GFN7_CAERE|nr:hypothetical protein GCK72_019785 [Caenorhabditis remanei]KAF1753229.1 hypothetical protein GCK72_019785 [Caenorhabditis remanei]